MVPPRQPGAVEGGPESQVPPDKVNATAFYQVEDERSS